MGNKLADEGNITKQDNFCIYYKRPSSLHEVSYAENNWA